MMVFVFIKMPAKITTAATLALFVIVLMPKVVVLGNSSDTTIEHMLPAYAIAKKSYILGESSKCRGELERFKEGVDGGKVWSLRMLDSSGAPKPGFMYGNNYWIGSRTQCYDTLNPEPLALHPKWLENNTLYRNPEEELAPYQLNYFAAHFLHNSTLQYHHRLANEHVMTLGLCLPATCETDELGMILEKVFQERTLSISQLYDMDLKLLYVKDLKDDPQYLMNWRMIIVILMIIMTLLLMAMATCYDVCVHQKRLKVNQINDANNNGGEQQILEKKHDIENGDPTTFSQPENHPSTLEQVLMCFSVYTNTINLFDTSVSEGSVASVHGLRFLGMVWIIMIHAVLYGQDFADNRTWSWRMSMDFPTQIISNGTLSVDTYFFLSGFLLSHIFFKNNRNKQDGVIREGNKNPKGLRWDKFSEAIIKRFFRLTPAYMMIVGIVEMNASFYHQTSQFYMTERPQETCSKYWWRNLLYINNFFSRDEMCLSWSWYLSNDTQFFIFGTMLLLMSAKFFYTAVVVLLATLFTSSLISGYLAYIYEYVPTLDQQWNTLDIFYDPPWMRIGPYIIGLATAYLLSKMGNKLDVKRRTLCLLWIGGSCCNLIVLFGLYDRTISVFSMSMYMALSRIVWGIGIAWIVIACCTEHGGIVNAILTFKGWVPLSKLTYCAYLLNPFLISSAYMSSESAFHVDFLPTGTFFFGYLMMTYFCAYATYLMFEVPYILLLKYYYNNKIKK